MTVKELAKYLNLKEKTVYYLVEKGDISHYRLCERGGIRFKKEDVDEWLDSKKADTSVTVKIAKQIYNKGQGRPACLRKVVK